MSAKEISYSRAIEELEIILRKIEEEEVDIDDLAQEVKRAAELIKLCKGKIEKAEVEINRVVQSFETEKPQEEENEKKEE